MRRSSDRLGETSEKPFGDKEEFAPFTTVENISICLFVYFQIQSQNANSVGERSTQNLVFWTADTLYYHLAYIFLYAEMTARSKVRNAMKATVGALMKMETHSCIRRQDLTAPIVIGVSFYFGFRIM